MEKVKFELNKLADNSEGKHIHCKLKRDESSKNKYNKNHLWLGTMKVDEHNFGRSPDYMGISILNVRTNKELSSRALLSS